MERSTTLAASTNGAASTPIDIADVSNDNWTIRLWAEAEAATSVLLAIQTSTDNFTNSRTIAVFSSAGIVGRVEKTVRFYETAHSLVGIANAKMRLLVQAIEPGGAIKSRLALEF